MDQGRFDDLTRSVMGEGGTRRALLRFLAGGTLGAVGRFGLADVAATKQRKKDKDQHNDNDKRKGKDKKRDRKRQDDTCCADGPCAAESPCCPGQKPCGGGCVAENICCWHSERTCPDGKCVPVGRCCIDERQCAGDKCVSWDTCCPEEKPCGDGCIQKEECCVDDTPPLCAEPGDEPLCCHGQEVCRPRFTEPGCPFQPERAYDAVTCRCLCPNNTNDSLGLCCPLGYHGSIGLDGYCCSGDTFDTCVCALGWNKVNGVCRRD